MRIIGKETIHPAVFYSGKICGYITWIALLLSILGILHLPGIATRPTTIMSVIILVIGLLTTAISLVNLGRSTSLGLPEYETTLKTGGLYKFSRNPMYVGFDLMTISSALYHMNLWVFALAVYSVYVYHLIILGEEKFLRKRFSGEYDRYASSVRRYV